MATTAAINSTTTPSVNLASAPAASTASDTTVSSERFLRLLVAQMQNQDPLNPMDNAQVTSQMAQINTVTGIEKLNTTVQGLSAQFMQLQAVQGASLVGHDVIVPGNRLDVDLDAKVAQGGFELASPADAVRVEILAPSGSVVQTLNIGASGAGMHSFDWPAEQAVAAAAGGTLTFRVIATSGSAAVPVTPLMRDHVDAVVANGNGFTLELRNSGTVPYSTVRAFN